MADFKISQRAREDLEAIWYYSFTTWGVNQAHKYARQFTDRFQQLADLPAMGQDASMIKNRYRQFKEGSHLIFYTQVSGEVIEIVRVLHERMDVNAQFPDDEQT